MNDKQAGVAMVAILELAIGMRTRRPNDIVVREAQRVLDACGGDAIQALCLAATVVPPEDEIDAWWQESVVVGVKTRQMIEQRIARGESDAKIAAETGATKSEIRAVWRLMDELAAE